MKSLALVLFVTLTLGSSEIFSVDEQPGVLLELYSTFHAIGVTVTIADTDDPNENVVTTVEYRREGEPYRAGFPLSRIGKTRFVGSLFWLDPGTSYDVRVSFRDPDGGPLNGVTVDATADTRQEITIPPANNTLIVSPDGDGTTCELSSPCTLAEGIRQAQPGDEVVLRGGIYYQGGIVLPRSGRPDAPIVIRSYDDERAILDGAEPKDYPWTATGNGVYVTTTNLQEINLMTANGVRLYPYDSLDSLQSMVWQLPGYYSEGQRLYIHLGAGIDPNGVDIAISRYNRGFNVGQDYIYFLDLTFRHFGQGSEARAIYFRDASNNLVKNSIFAINNGGMTIRAESHRNVIQDNEFYDTIFTWPWTAVKETRLLERGGVYFGGPGGGRGNVIRRNTFHDFFDAFDICPGELSEKTNETDVYENLVFNVGDDGVQADGWCSNVRLWNNTFHNVLNGVSMAPVVVGPVYAIRNVIYSFGAGNTGYRGGSFKFNHGSNEQSGPIFLLHNTADAVNAEPYGLQVNSGSSNGWQSIFARNNNWSSVNVALRYDNPDYSIDFDYNNLWNGNHDSLVRWNGTSYDTLPTLSEVTGQELHGLNVDPMFVSPFAGDYRLSADSPLIDAGLLIPGINDNFVGQAPDIGALEFTMSDDTQSYLPFLVSSHLTHPSPLSVPALP